MTEDDRGRAGSTATSAQRGSTMRTEYHEQLSALDRQFGDMCGVAGVAMRQATQALLDADVAVRPR